MSKPKILAIDDEMNFTDMLRQYFEPRGYEIASAVNGNDALKVLERDRYDVILLDFKMAGINGDEVMKKIKQSHPETTVIFITAYNDAGKTRERLLHEGAYAYIEKPIASLKSLENLVNEVTVR